tara:strand:- start:429 stop:860 length:432 start_codon:yes stop_codon:yes gene_type:complete
VLDDRFCLGSAHGCIYIDFEFYNPNYRIFISKENMTTRRRKKPFDMRRYRRKNKSCLKQKKFAGKICEQVPFEDLQAGDYITYWDSGWRVAEVKKNHKGYKHRWIRICALKTSSGYVLRRSKKIKENQIKEVWRETKETGSDD